MDEAARTRRAARQAIEDVDPAALQDAIDDLLANGSMSPGALALSCAVAGESVDDGSTTAEQRAAGVQLIYDGLRLTRDLAHTEPWSDPAERTAGNLDILAADVMVARGFYLLARTDAADKAVETVRSFGRAQTERREADADRAALDACLEADILELAAVAGTVAGTEDDGFRKRAVELGHSVGVRLPPAEQLLAEFHDGRRATPVDHPTEDHVSAPDD